MDNNNNNFLSLSELAEKIHRSEKTLLKNFNRTKENLAKKGIYIERFGGGKNTWYNVKYEGEE